MNRSVYDPQSLNYISGNFTFATGGYLNMDGGGTGSSADGGNVWTYGGTGVGATGGHIKTHGGSSASATGGVILTNGGTLPGGNITTYNGGGNIDTRGTGSLELGVSGTRTTVNGSATANRTLTLPDASGTFALLGDTRVTSKITGSNYTIGTTDSRELYGGVIYVTGAATITIPAVASGGSFTVVTIGAVAVSVDPNASDLIVRDGVAQADGEKVTNLSTAGDISVFTYYDGTGWYCASNGWTNGG